jgi:hypothetical protein
MYLKICFIPHSNTGAITKSLRLTMFKDILDIFSENHFKNMNTLCSQIQNF